MTHARCDHFRVPARTGGFTLIEVMISIAIVLVLIIGVNQVFKVAADTVGTGQALSSKVRDGRAAQAVFYDELNHVARDGPFLVISSRAQAAFETPIDRANDADGIPRTLDFDSNNIEGENTIPGELVPATAINSRNHRLDLLTFFARDLYRRQTGNSDGANNVYAADQSSNEAWVTYGHLRVYNQASPQTVAKLDDNLNYLDPGAGAAASNPRNYYASDWQLGRVQMLLIKGEDTNLPPDKRSDQIQLNPIIAGNLQRFWRRKDPGATPGDIQRLEPLGPFTQLDNATAPVITDARYDLAGTTFDDFGKNVLTEYIKHTLEYARVGAATQDPAPFANEWWDIIAPQWDPTNTSAGYRSTRFRCNPYPERPLNARKVAQAAPALLTNCSQFIVEFAGDFLTQNVDPDGNTIINAADQADVAYGRITAPVPDGILDFYVAGDGVQKIRWYGLPRDVNGDGVILGNPGPTWPANDNPNMLVDVVPIRDVLHTNTAFRAVGSPTQYGLPFERTVRYPTPTSTTPVVPLIEARNNYALVNLTAAPGAGNGMSPLDRYVVAWGPGEDNATRPKLIRLIVTLSDPSGRIAAGQTYEYVVNLP
ncbi:MAG: hypothetical protein QOF78_3626 [Phycisphaerales bacterium]|jgi:prepilin-type N-terminal cleavage/methylation domain-containing protein|nr:hypothetical protein [Phycisphaerales bacterium]